MAGEQMSDESAQGLLQHELGEVESWRSGDQEQTADPADDHIKLRRLLYTSHFLSTWNSRLFEFGAFLFLAEIYPNTLLPASVYALTRAASAALLSPWLGSYIDRADRLSAVRWSIVGQRLAVTVSCTILLLMVYVQSVRSNSLWSALLLSGLCLLAAIEKLSSVLNTISVERDWVVVVAGDREDRLRTLNSQMRRIDLFCKLVGPLAIAVSNGITTPGAIIFTGALTCLSLPVEYITIARVYRSVPDLSLTRQVQPESHGDVQSLQQRASRLLAATSTYVQHPAFLASFSLSLLYLTVLSFAGQMITYLLNLGISSSMIGILRGVSAIFELSATFIAPWVTKQIGPVRGGIYFLNYQAICVSVACLFFWMDWLPSTQAIGTILAVIASRIGLWGFDLSVQLIIQEEVEEDMRGTFSAQEFALQNVFEMLAFGSTIVFPDPNDFKFPATISTGAVGLAGVCYAVFVRGRRGHLVHLSRCIDPKGKDHEHWWMGRHGSR